jgi:hypothetical protein
MTGSSFFMNLTMMGLVPLVFTMKKTLQSSIPWLAGAGPTALGRLAEVATRTRGLSPNVEEAVSQCHPMSLENSGRGTLVPRGLLEREPDCLCLSCSSGWVQWESRKTSELACHAHSCRKNERNRGEHPGRCRQFGDAIRTVRRAWAAWLGRSDLRPAKVCSDVCPSGLSLGHSPEVTRLAGAGPTPSGGSLRQLLAPEVLAQTWRKWQASVTP